MAEQARETAQARHAKVLLDTVRLWEGFVAEALAGRATLSDDEVVEYMVGYLEPKSSWKAVATEMAESFPGATVHVAEVLRDLVAFLDAVVAGERLVTCAAAVLADLQASLAGVREETLRVGSDCLIHAVSDMDEAVDLLSRLGSSVTLGERNVLVAMLARRDRNGPR